MKPCDKCWGTGSEIDHEKLGKFVRKVRTSRGVPLARQARMLGVSESFLSLLESGKRTWTEALYNKATK